MARGAAHGRVLVLGGELGTARDVATGLEAASSTVATRAATPETACGRVAAFSPDCVVAGATTSDGVVLAEQPDGFEDVPVVLVSTDGGEASAVYTGRVEAVLEASLSTVDVNDLLAAVEDALGRRGGIPVDGRVARYETLIETVPVGLFALDADGVITWANEVYAETLDIPREDLVDTPFEELVERGYYDESVPERYVEEVGRLLSSETDVDVASYEVETHVPDGDRLVHQAYVALLPLRDGEFSGTVVAFRDVTAHRAYERELERQNERLDTFTSMVSHDLRNPLSVARGRLRLALEAVDDPDVVEDLEAAEASHGRMEAMIDDLLTLARQGRAVDEARTVDVAAVASAAWETVSTGSATLEVREDVATVRADPDRLQQLLENLFRNAVEHAVEADDPEDAALAVTVGSLDREPGFYVADDGRGIPPEDREQVFEHGFTTDDDGTGIGLQIVRTIAEAHGWTVDLADGESGGACFEFRVADASVE